MSEVAEHPNATIHEFALLTNHAYVLALIAQTLQRLWVSPSGRYNES